MTDTTLTDAARDDVRASIRDSSVLNIPYLVMNTLATVIASYGLFANSPAVIIGAMIVAMLLGPIIGISLALTDSDYGQLFKALVALLAGTICVMITAFILGLLNRDIPITDEILARTAPNLLDLMIALAGGAAGAYATVSPRLSVAFIGVAVATALVPPLASASILFAHGEYVLGGGAFLLAFTNMVAIQFAAAVVLWVTGFRRRTGVDGFGILNFLKRDAFSLGILIVLGVLMARNLNQVVEQQLFETKVRATLSHLIDASPGSFVSAVRFAPGKGTTIVRALVRAPNPPSPAAVALLAAKLPSPPNQTVIDLRVRYVQTTVITPHGSLYKDEEFSLGE